MDGKVAHYSFIAGGIAGAVDSCVTMPLDTLKLQLQLSQRKGTTLLECYRKVVQNDGAVGLYRGFAPFLVQAMGKSAVRFTMFGLLTDLVSSVPGIDRKGNRTLWSALCGGGAGLAEALCWTAPNERLKILQQATAGSGGKSVPYMVLLQQLGVRGIYVGAVPTALRQATSAAVRFAIVDHVKELFRIASGAVEGEALPFYVSFLAGGVGGALSVVLNNPIDVVKSRIQAGYGGGSARCLRDIVREKGLTALGAGLSARVPRLFVSQAIQFAVADRLIAELMSGRANSAAESIATGGM
jgi:solute carrier family 25 citrate transporter 1